MRVCVRVGGRGVLMLQSAAVGLQRVDVGERQENQHILVEQYAASRQCVNKKVIFVCFDCHIMVCVKKDSNRVAPVSSFLCDSV